MLKNKMESVKLCRSEGLDIQKLARHNLEKILSLNPSAQALRLQRKILEAKIVAAFAAGQLELVAALKFQRHKIVLEQKTLDKIQKSLLAQANTTLFKRTWHLHQDLNHLLKSKELKIQPWAHYSFMTLPPKIPTLALTPEDSNLAPVYKPKKKFENKQSISLAWLQQYQWKNFMRFTRQINSKQRSQCSITLEENTWKEKIQKDRLL